MHLNHFQTVEKRQHGGYYRSLLNLGKKTPFLQLKIHFFQQFENDLGAYDSCAHI